jgi:ribonuclease HI
MTSAFKTGKGVGQLQRQRILAAYRTLKNKFTHLEVEVQWALGHGGVEGNKMADEAAKARNK